MIARLDDVYVGIVSKKDIILKINKLVDAVNELQAQVAILEEHAHPTAKTEPTDPYAEQRKWIGTLCRFRHALGVDPTYGILGEISTDSDFPYYKKDTDTYWKYCEPVKPDDDIIYKGGDND